MQEESVFAGSPGSCSETCLSPDAALCAAAGQLEDAGLTSIFDRYEAQQPQCKQGTQGTCCTLCANGPCRITGKATMGVCGASPDLIVARNLLQKAAIGTAGNTYHAENAARTLLAAGRGEGAFTVADPAKLQQVAAQLGIDTDRPDGEVAQDLAQFVIDELNKPDNEPLALVEALAPPRRVEVWRKLGVMPGGVNSEIRTSLVKCMTSVNNDPVDLLLSAMRLSVANAYAGLDMINVLQDILLGKAGIGQAASNLGTLDEETVNIICHGHQPLLGSLVGSLAAQERFQDQARAAGATGIKVYGSMCEGQEMAQRQTDSYGGQIGNWLHQEFLLATGAVDLMMMDYNCSIPTLPAYAEKFGTVLVTTDQSVRMAGVERLEHTPATADETAAQILERAIGAFGQRSGTNIPPVSRDIVAGFSTETVLAALGGSLKPLVEAIASGSIRGIAAVVGCTTSAPDGRGNRIEQMTRDLVARDILVVSAGCTSSTLQNAGFCGPDSAVTYAGPGLKAVCDALGVPPVLSFGSCTDIGRITDVAAAVAAELDVDIPQLPVAVTAPEWLEQKAVADAFFAVSFGLLTHLSPVPPVTGSPLVAGVLTADVEQLTGGRVAVEEDPAAAAQMIADHIETKRRGLGLT